MKVDDMKVSDFLYLLDSMQEECCENKRCDGCRYIDFCHVDLPSIDSLGIRRAVEGYAEANCLLDHMHYMNDQKWIPVSESLPKSNYYNKDRDDKDIYLIESIVKKEIPKKPESESEYFVGEDNVKITVTVFFCPNCGDRIGHRDNYCNNCGQRIEWEEQQ